MQLYLFFHAVSLESSKDCKYQTSEVAEVGATYFMYVCLHTTCKAAMPVTVPLGHLCREWVLVGSLSLLDLEVKIH